MGNKAMRSGRAYGPRIALSVVRSTLASTSGERSRGFPGIPGFGWGLMTFAIAAAAAELVLVCAEGPAAATEFVPTFDALTVFKFVRANVLVLTVKFVAVSLTSEEATELVLVCVEDGPAVVLVMPLVAGLLAGELVVFAPFAVLCVLVDGFVPSEPGIMLVPLPPALKSAAANVGTAGILRCARGLGCTTNQPRRRSRTPPNTKQTNRRSRS